MKPQTEVGGGTRSVEVVEPQRERASTARVSPVSKIHFHVHPFMPELQRYAHDHGWLERGFTHLSVPWLALRYTVDAWATTRDLKSTDVPSPIVNGWFNLPDVPKGSTVEFAVHVGLACHAPGDAAGVRERGELWLNNEGKNYTQVSQ